MDIQIDIKSKNQSRLQRKKGISSIDLDSRISPTFLWDKAEIRDWKRNLFLHSYEYEENVSQSSLRDKRMKEQSIY